ncbi:MAG: hypothetical protein ACRDF4_04805, partial [Rhabdochlamydiaceae bacterium]
SYTPYQVQWQKGYVDSLRSDRPRFIIVAWKMKFWAVPNFDVFLHSLPGFDHLLSIAYDQDNTFGGYTIFRLKNDQKSGD